MTPTEKPAVLLAAPVLPALELMLENAFAVHKILPGPGRAEVLRQTGGGVRAAVVSGSHGLDLEEMAALPDLGLVCVFGVGLDALHLPHLRDRRIAVTTTPVLTDDVADLAVALWLAVARQIPRADRFVRGGEWALTGQHPLAGRASGRRMGVVGFGRIGQAIARRVEPFASEVLYSSRRASPMSSLRFVPSLLELAEVCDVLFLAAPGGPDTVGLVGEEVLNALGPTGVLVNVARGSLVDEPALIAALGEGRLGAAALDVFVGEPHVAPELLAQPNVVLSPHIGSATVECRLEMAECVMANLKAFFQGRNLPTQVSWT